MNKIVHIFTQVDLRLGHPGLKEVALKKKVNVEQLEVGEYVLFTNNSLTGMKVYAANNTVIYCKSPAEHRPFDIRGLNALPQFMDGASINYDDSIRAVLVKKYAHLLPKGG